MEKLSFKEKLDSIETNKEYRMIPQKRSPKNLYVWFLAMAILIGCGYFFVNIYQEYKAKKELIFEQTKKEQDATKDLILAQTKALEDTQREIEKLKEQNTATETKQKVLIQDTQQKPKLTREITSSDINPYLYGVVVVNCGQVQGSGSLWKLNGKYYVLTNQHVVEESTLFGGYCLVPAYNISGEIGYYLVAPSDAYRWNDYTDVALLPLYNNKGENNDKTKLVYSLSSMQKCASTMPTNSPVVVIGYPAYAQKDGDTQITTNGITSGFGPADSNLLNPNYYVSAKIDSGNSGGVALSKDSDGLCILGIPTWVNVGNFETIGVVQNIHNVMSK